MGMKDKAKEQSAMFVTKKIDPGAPTYSLDFLRKHPEISIESVPWHVHTDRPHTEDAVADPPAAKVTPKLIPGGTH
jgi:hypothetical protein